MLYVETSAVLAVLFREAGYEPIASAIEGPITKCSSALTFLEARRAISRLVSSGSLTEAKSRDLIGQIALIEDAWVILQITEAVQLRAGYVFPVEPVRALDAIHLATALEFRSSDRELSVLALDKRVVDNLRPLGIDIYVC